MNRAIDATAAEEGPVRRIHDGLNVKFCDVPNIEVDVVVRCIRFENQVNELLCQQECEFRLLSTTCTEK